MKDTVLFLMISALVAFAGCSNTDSVSPAESASQQQEIARPPQAEGQLRGEVLETMDSGGYTYVRINNGSEDLWAAGPETEVKVGDSVQLVGGMLMTDFHSKTLNRTFDRLFFVSAIQSGSASSQTSQVAAAHSGMESSAPASDLSFEGIEKAGHTVAELYQSRDELAGKEVSVRGRVVKFNPSILKRNWIHIQDGTGTGESSDITVTTQEEAEVGSLVTVTGTLVENQDFGFGYEYDLLIEGASVTNE